MESSKHLTLENLEETLTNATASVSSNLMTEDILCYMTRSIKPKSNHEETADKPHSEGHSTK